MAMLTMVKSYLAGELPLKRVFLYDMLLVGTLVNVTTGIASLAAAALNVPPPLAVAIFLAPQAYNIVLCLAVWRSAAQDASRWNDLARIGTMIWYPLMFFV
jgi:hypothetical protein